MRTSRGSRNEFCAQEEKPPLRPERDCLKQAGPQEGAELLTQLVGGGDNVGGDTRVQISVHDAQRVQLGHVMPSDLKGVTTAQSPPGTGGGGGGVGGGEGEVKG